MNTKHFENMPLLFFGHIAAMSLAWFFMVVGVAVYNISPLEKRKNRIAHGVLMSLALLAVLVGFASIFANHAKMGQSQFGFDTGNPLAKTVHALVGWVLIALLLWQGVQGFLKYVGLANMNMKLISLTKKHAPQGYPLVIIVSCNIAVVLTAMVPMDTYMYWVLAVGSVAVPSFTFAASSVAMREAPAITEDAHGYEQLPPCE